VENVEKVLMPRIIENLTRSREDIHAAAPASSKKWIPDSSAAAVRNDGVVFEGTFEEINDYFRRQEWSDDLPIIPPTPEKVEAFLKHTKRAPDEGIAVLAQA